jgi:hypothetical protein
VEEPDTGIVGDKAQSDRIHGGDLDGVAADWVGLSFDGWWV